MYHGLGADLCLSVAELAVNGRGKYVNIYISLKSTISSVNLFK